MAGDVDRALDLFDELLDDVPSGVDQADLLNAVSLTGRESIPERARLCERALAEAGDDDARAVEFLAQLAVYRWFAGDMPGALDAARSGLVRARRLGDRRLLTIALARVAYIETWALEETPGVLDEAVELESTLDVPLPFYQSSQFSLAARMFDRDDPAAACDLLERCIEPGLWEGAEQTLHFALYPLTIAEWQLGRLESALLHARATREFARQGRDPQYRGMSEGVNAIVEADLGLLDEARRSARSGLQAAAAVGDAITSAANLAALGHVELLVGDYTTAVQRLEEVPGRLLRSGCLKGIHPLAWPDTIEALIGTGDLESARRHLEHYEDIAAIARGLHRLGAARCRALLAAAQGDTAVALRVLEDVVRGGAASSYPLERARTLLALGVIRRRALQRRAARDALEDSLAAFEQLGARPWAVKAREELGRISGRRPPAQELTEAERRVAELAAEGHRNKEIATRLFVTVRTVETTLARAYRKLGVRSRTELAFRLSNRDDRASKV